MRASVAGALEDICVWNTVWIIYVIKCYSSLPTPRSAPSNTINLDNEKLQMSSTKLYNIDQRTMSNQRGRRSNTSQACMKNQQEDTRNLIPSNIRHKYGSSVVDQLICPVQVRSCLREEERRLCHQGYCIPKLSMKSCFMEDYPHKIYYELGHCLRSNLFPGLAQSLIANSTSTFITSRSFLLWINFVIFSCSLK